MNVRNKPRIVVIYNRDFEGAEADPENRAREDVKDIADHIIRILDANGYQAMGRTDEVMQLGCIADKLTAFGLEVREADGHDEEALDAVIGELLHGPWERPRALVAHTVKGKGVRFMEGDNRWHYTRLTAETYAAAVRELDA